MTRSKTRLGHSPNRRQFARVATGCSLGMATGLTRQGLAKAKSDMTLGFSTYGMPKMGTIEALQLLGRIGYDSVEIVVREGWDADSASLRPGKMNAIRDELRSQGLRLTSLMEHVFPTSEEKQRVALERLRLATEVAQKLSTGSVPIVQTVLGSGDFESEKSILVDRLGKWADLGSKSGVPICIKPHRGGIVSRPSQAAWLLEQLRQPKYLKMVYDYSHYAFRDITVADSLKVAAPYIAHVAVKDVSKAADKVEFKLPGESGEIDFVQILTVLKEQGYGGDINCEVSGMVSGKANYDPVHASKFCYEKMTRIFDQAMVARER